MDTILWYMMCTSILSCPSFSSEGAKFLHPKASGEVLTSLYQIDAHRNFPCSEESARGDTCSIMIFGILVYAGQVRHFDWICMWILFRTVYNQKKLLSIVALRPSLFDSRSLSGATKFCHKREYSLLCLSIGLSSFENRRKDWAKTWSKRSKIELHFMSGCK